MIINYWISTKKTYLCISKTMVVESADYYHPEH